DGVGHRDRPALAGGDLDPVIPKATGLLLGLPPVEHIDPVGIGPVIGGREGLVPIDPFALVQTDDPLPRASAQPAVAKVQALVEVAGIGFAPGRELLPTGSVCEPGVTGGTGHGRVSNKTVGQTMPKTRVQRMSNTWGWSAVESQRARCICSNG